MAHDRFDVGGIGGVHIWTTLGSSAVLSSLRPARTACRPETLGGLLPLCNAESRYSLRRTPERRPRDRPSDDLGRTSSSQLVSAARCPTAPRLLSPPGHRHP